MTKPSRFPANPLTHLVQRLRTSKLLFDPYPYYFLENVFPKEYYRTLLRHLPDENAYQNLFTISSLKLEHLQFREQRDLNDGWTKTLSPALKTFWEDFNAWLFSPALAQAVLDSFAAPLHTRFGDQAAWPDVSVEAQLIRHKAGYFLQPHSDLHTKLIVLLIYLPADASATHLGTSLYRPKEHGFTCARSAHYPFEDFIRVGTVPYRPNTLLAFERSDRSFHGVEPLSAQDTDNGNRDLIQYVIYDKAAREAQLRERRLAAAPEPAG